MPSSDFQASVVQPRPGVVAVRMRGELDIASIDVFKAAAVQALEVAAEADESQTVVVDLASLQFIDSTGLRALVEIQSAADKQGARFCLLQGPDVVMKVFWITKLDERFEIHSGLDDAVG